MVSAIIPRGVDGEDAEGDGSTSWHDCSGEEGISAENGVDGAVTKRTLGVVAGDENRRLRI